MFLFFKISVADAKPSCPRGYDALGCNPCKQGVTFNKFANSDCLECLKCQINEHVIRKCITTENTLCKCNSGYIRNDVDICVYCCDLFCENKLGAKKTSICGDEIVSTSYGILFTDGFSVGN